jgi:hypothetical protein
MARALHIYSRDEEDRPGRRHYSVSEEMKMIRKYFAAIMMAVMVAAAVPMLAGTASAQRRRDGRYSDRYRDRSRDRYSDRSSDRSYGSNVYYGSDGYYDGTYDNNRPSTYDRHRKAVNIGAATGAGAVLGAIFGGKKGASSVQRQVQLPVPWSRRNSVLATTNGTVTN